MSVLVFRAMSAAVLLACSVLPIAHARKNDIGDGSDTGSMPIVPLNEPESAYVNAANWFWQSYPMQALTTVFPHLAPPKKGYLEVINLSDPEDINAKQKIGQQLIAMVNKGLRTTPDYDKALGFAVGRAWNPRSGTFLMEVQSVRLADKALHVLSGLTIGQQKLGMRVITAADVEAEGITLCGWTRRQRFLLHFLLIGGAISGIVSIISSGGWTLDIFAAKPLKKASKMDLPFHGASVVGGASSFRAHQQTSCVARSVPKQLGQEI